MTGLGATRERSLEIIAAQYVDQAFRHTKLKILKEARNRGYKGHEILRAIKAMKAKTFRGPRS